MTAIADRPAAVHEGVTRVDGPDKVAGRARYAAEHPMAELAYACPVTSTVSRGEIVQIATDTATATPGVLAVLHWGDVPHASGHDDPELALFRSPMVSYRGQIVAAVVATTLEVAQEVAARIEIEYRVAPHDVELRPEHPGLYTPAHVNPDFDTDSFVGDVEQGLADSAATVDATYTTPAQHNHPMEPHACTAWWDGDHLTVIDSTQGPWRGRAGIAAALGLDPGQVRVIVEHVGGGFGSKGTTRGHAVVAALAARAVDRPVRCVLARRQMPAVVGHRTPSIQRCPPRRRRRLAAPRHQPRRGRADLTYQGVRRADRGRHPPHVRGTQPPDDPPARPPRRADAGMDARAGGVPRHVRPRVGDRRACDGARHRPDRAPDPQRAEGRPRERSSLLQPEPRGLPPGRCGALRVGRARPDPATRAQGPLVGRYRRGGQRVPGPRRAVTRPRHDRRASSLHGRDRRQRHRHRRAHRAADRGGGGARRADDRDRGPHRRHRLRRGDDRRRIHGHRLVDVGDRRGGRRPPGPHGGARRPGPAGGVERRGAHRGEHRAAARQRRGSPSARNSPRLASTSTPGRSGYPGSSVSLPPGASSARSRPGRSSSAA